MPTVKSTTTFQAKLGRVYEIREGAPFLFAKIPVRIVTAAAIAKAERIADALNDAIGDRPWEGAGPPGELGECILVRDSDGILWPATLHRAGWYCVGEPIANWKTRPAGWRPMPKATH